MGWEGSKPTVNVMAVSGTAIPASVGSGSYKWLGGVVADGKLYGIPCSAGQIIVEDLATRAVSGIAVPASVGSGNCKWRGGAVADGKLYGIPCDADQIMEMDPYPLLDLEAALAKLGPLTLQCLDGSKFEVEWPAKVKHGATLNLRKLAAKAHPATVLGAADFRLMATATADEGGVGGGGGGGGEPLDVSVLDPDMLRQMVRGLVPTTLTVVF